MTDKELYRKLDLKKSQLQIQLKQTKSKAKKEKLHQELNELMPKWLKAFNNHYGVGGIDPGYTMPKGDSTRK